MILKDIMKPTNKQITSYVMKNIILWQAENNPQNRFNARSLFHWLHDALKDLRTAFVTKQLSLEGVTAFYAPFMNRILFSYFPLVNIHFI